MNRYLTLFLLTVLFSCQSPENPTFSPDSEELLTVIEQSTQSFPKVASAQGAPLLVLQPFQNPPEVSSQSSRLQTELDIRFATNTMYNTSLKQNVEVYHRSYNGQLVGSTWRIKPGDSLLVDVQNRLAAKQCNSDPLNPAHHHGGNINVIDTARFNTTNLHVHGFHVSPKGHSDNVFVEIEPGCNFQNRYLLPDDHAPGTFWYHGHVHGSTAMQVSSGLAGAIIIEGGLDNLPEIKAMEEKIFVLQQMPYLYDTAKERYDIPWSDDNFGPSSWKKNAKKNGWLTTINGQAIPVIEMAPNEVQRWRFVHAGVRETVNLRLFDQRGNERKLEAQDFYAIAEDGIAYGYSEKKDLMELQPGYRADLLVQAPDKEDDRLYLMDIESKVLGGFGDDDAREIPKLLAVIELKAKADPVATKIPDDQTLAPLAPYPSLANITPTAPNESVVFNIAVDSTPTQFQINGVPFDPANIRQLDLNAIQDWELSSDFVDHPFHIHVNHFQVLGTLENGKLQKFDRPKWKDTYFVVQGVTTLVRTHYKNFTGKFVIHCHILDHEDQGMMQSVEILPPSGTAMLNDTDITQCGPVKSDPIAALPPYE